jgi:hypothetical protein
MFVVDGDGEVWRANGAGRWEGRASVGGQPAALDSGPRDELLVALHDGTIKLSTDGAASWSIRSRPD